MKSKKIKRHGIDFELRQKKYMEYDFNVENENKRQWYEGETVLGNYHGLGDYHWDFNTVYEGRFYSNAKDGYATLSFPDNSIFEGLFIKNHAFGPGIFTYANGSQDVGFWLGRKLVRLSRAVEFLVPRLAPTSASKIKLLQFRHLIPINEDFDPDSEPFNEFNYMKNHVFSPYSNSVFDPRSLFFNKILFDHLYLTSTIHNTSDLALHSDSDGNIRREEWEPESDTEIPNEFIIPRTCTCHDEDLTFVFDKDTIGFCEEIDDLPIENLGILAYYWKYGTFKNFQNDAINPPTWELNVNAEGIENNLRDTKKITHKRYPPAKIVSWNRSNLCTKMLKEIFRYRAFEGKVNLNVGKLMLGVRTAFRKTGRRERSCLQFLRLCSIGPVYAVKEFLCSNEVSAELMDARGNNGIMFAAANDQRDVIDALLDYGVDANSFNDEGLTPLNLCLLRRLARTNGISNWEIAFLPAHTSNALESPENEEPLKKDSVPSFGEIFGEETENNDDTFKYKNDLQEEEQNYFSGEKSASISSQITIFKAKETSKTEKLNGSKHSYKIEMKTSKTSKRDDLEPNAEEQYLFDLTLSPTPIPGNEKPPIVQERSSSVQISIDGIKKPLSEEEKKLKEIDKTIEKLLERGADPNTSEVPKPSIHLALFTKNINIVKSLLLYGAHPDAQLHANEGSLTPLQVVVLLTPTAVNASICRLLVDFDADPDRETLPDFRTYKEEILLDPLKGRTPLQLLCMRPDLEFVHYPEYASKMATILAKVCNRQNTYGGHSYITLSMISGNVKLLQTLLKTKYFDPNSILENGLGTALHILVSTPFQMKIPYDKSIEMCDLLLDAGADPLLRLEAPEKLVGTCVDFGHREIEAEKNRRKPVVTNGKKNTQYEKRSSIDYLKDHIKVVEYLEKKVNDIKKKLHKGFSDHEVKHESAVTLKRDSEPKTTEDQQNETPEREKAKKEQHKKSPTRKKEIPKPPPTKQEVKPLLKRLSFQEIDFNEQKKPKATEEKVEEAEESAKDLPDQTTKKGVKTKEKLKDKKKKRHQNDESSQDEPEHRDKKKKKKSKRDDDEYEQKFKEKKRKKREGKEDDEDFKENKKKRKKKGKEDEEDEQELKGKKKKMKKEGKKDEIDDQEVKGKKKKKKGKESDDEQEVKEKKKKKKGKESDDEQEGKKKKEKKKGRGDDEVDVKRKKEKKKRREDDYELDFKGKKEKKKKKGDDEVELKERRKKGKKKDKIDDQEIKEKKKKRKEERKEEYEPEIKETKTEKVTEDKQKVEERKIKESKTRFSEEKGFEVDDSKREYVKESSKLLIAARSETFPERLRQTLLRMFDHCANFDINKFLLPYVVLRDGNLYYRFKGRTCDRKEQYSLI